jgi:glycosyltransferase involved in cell wall biosynthesis
MMNRDVVPETSISFIEPWLAKRNRRLIFDFDDAIHLGPREKKLRKILPCFAWLTPGNEYLASFVRQVNPHVSIWPTVVDTEYYHPIKEREAGPIRIGWSGSNMTLQTCLPLIEKIIIQLAQKVDFQFIVIAEVPPQISWPEVKWKYIPWTPQTEVEGLQQIDIGVMPLEDKPYERGKCGLKAIQYMGVGIPALVSPVGVNKNIINHGENGFHCNNEEEWLMYLHRLLLDKGLRKHMGSAGRNHVEKTYSIKAQLPIMTNIFEKVATGDK